MLRPDDNRSDSELPRMIFLETTTACNLRCSLCPRFVDDYAQHGTFMPIEVYERVQPYFPTLAELALVGCGEPLTDRRILDFVAEAAAHKIYVMFTTNGTLLNPELSLKIVRSGLSMLGVSVDGASKQVFEQIRDGANFEAVIGNLRQFIQIRNSHGTRPIVKVQVVILKQNLEELPDLVRLAAEIGADELYAKKPSVFSNNEGAINSSQESFDALVYAHQRDMVIRKALETARSLGFRAVFPSYQQEGPSDCPYHPQRQLYIRREGDVFPCPIYAVTHSTRATTRSTDGKCMGNVLQTPLPIIWQSKVYREFRRRFISGTEETCLTCSLWRQGYRVYSPRPIYSYCY